MWAPGIWILRTWIRAEDICTLNSTVNKEGMESIAKCFYGMKKVQGRIQACFDSAQPLWAPKKTAQIFLQVQINNRIFR